MEKKTLKSLIPPKTPEEALTLFENDFLKEVFYKGGEAITRVIDLVETGKLSSAVERKLKVWLFNYLSRNAKNTLFEQRGPAHFSPFEQKRSNQNEYYRMNGGAITPLLLTFLKETYSLPEKGYYLGSIKENHFSFLAEVVFHESPFYDISNELQAAFPETLEELMNTCKEKDPRGIFGGEFILEKQSFYFVFSEQNIEPVMQTFGSIRSGTGAVPDLAHLYHFLIDKGFPLERLYTISPIPLQPIKATIKHQEPLTAIPQTAIADHYLRFFAQYQFKNPHLHAIVKIDQNPTLSLKRKFHEILQEVYLAYEELSFSQILEGRKTPSLQKALHATTPCPPYKKTHLCTSGMSGYFHVLKGLKSFYGKRPKGAFLNTTYYEIVHKPLFGEALNLLCSPEIDLTIDDFLDPSQTWDLLCMDLYPNFVSLDPVEIPPLKTIVQTHLKNRKTPLTLLLDITGTTIHDEKLPFLVTTFEKEIEEGTFHLIFVSSLAKFYTGGMDKYGGGFVQIYSKSFTLEIDDPLSEEGETFFSLIFHEEGTWLKEYFQTIQNNSDLMYSLLLPLQSKETLFSLCAKDKGIPFIGLSFQTLASQLTKKPLTNHHLNCTAYFLQYYLVAKALTQDLTLTVRDSFGFPTSNMRECGGALRLTVGIENPSLLEEMASWLIQEEKTLKEELSTLTEETLAQTDHLLGIDPRFFMNWIEKMKLILVDYAKEHTFIETLQYLYSSIDPEKIFEKILFPLSQEDKAWVIDWKRELTQMLQTNFFSKQNLENFIHTSLLPLRPHLEKIYTKSKKRSFKTLIEKEKKLWLDFLLTHPLEKLETYIQNVSAIHEQVAHLLLTSPHSLEALQALKEEALSFAKDCTPQELESFFCAH